MKKRSFAKMYPHDFVLRATILKLVPRFVRPNHVTLLRMFLTPFVLYFLYLEDYRIGVPLFVFTAFTDLLDGSIARVRNQITPWGIFFDPVADKLLIGSVALLVGLRYFHPLLVFSALALDVLPATLFLARRKPKSGIMMANTWGKTKMFLQFVAFSSLLSGILFGQHIGVTIGEVTLGVSLVFALIAAVTYSL